MTVPCHIFAEPVCGIYDSYGASPIHRIPCYCWDTDCAI
nr:MAG TPA: hypothetical protein [Caudoviricetes sp.]